MPPDPLPIEIENSLTYVTEKDARTFRKKFRQQARDPRQREHTAIELAVGVWGRTLGFVPQYEPGAEGQTPDWMFNDSNGKPCLFAEVLNFHMAADIERDIQTTCDKSGAWRGFLPGSENRLHQPLRDKAAKYKALADELDLAFIVVIYGFFDSFLHPKEVEACVRHPEYGLFKDFPQLTGVYLMECGMPLGKGPQQEGYQFCFFANESAARPLILRDGLLPRPIAPPG